MPTETPLYDFLRHYAHSGTARLHMPGHKGQVIPGDPLSAVFPYDITEINGADNLFDETPAAPRDGVIAQSERLTARAYGTYATLFSAGGSTLCIQAMLALAAPPGSTVIAARNVHRAFLNACALLDLHVEWVLPRYEPGSLVGGHVDAGSLASALSHAPSARCVYLTSPDYLGCISDVKAVAAFCRQHGLTLLVDNAHGAHLKFLRPDLHPITLGADLCCDSAHKTLPALTGGAFLHVGNPTFLSRARGAMALFGSTSPSYLILCSLDRLNPLYETTLPQSLAHTADVCAELRRFLEQHGFPCTGEDPLRLTVEATRAGWDGRELANALREMGIECEYASDAHLVLMIAASTPAEDFSCLKRAFAALHPRPASIIELPDFTLPPAVMSIRDATFAENETIPTAQSAGRVCAAAVTACPPAVPVVVNGELIRNDDIKILQKYSISRVKVVK